jgi:GntR family transcriptional regulator of gluconate operon
MTHPLLLQRASFLGDQVVDVLRRQIITQDLPAGSLLVESKLAEAFQVSRGPIRDAIRVLLNEGLVESRGRSVAVVELTAVDIDELFSLRASLERLGLQTALLAHRDDLDVLLRAAIERMKLAVIAKDPAEFTLADMQFHSSFGIASQHRRLADVWSQYQPTIENLLLLANLDHDRLATSLDAHEDLADLVRAGKDDEALDELATHLDGSRIRLRQGYSGS